MKYQSKRVFSLLMTLAMLVSLFCAVWTPAQAATVNYVKDGNYVYNWGVRDEPATFLSPMAEDFYDENGVTYQQLASYTGSSNPDSVPDSSLFLKLHELMYDNLDNRTTYGGTRELYRYTDCQNSALNDDTISSFYSGISIGPDWDSGATWNREHVWPNSQSNSTNDSNSSKNREADIMMLRPTTVSENSSRNNTPYGVGSGYYDPDKLGQNVRGDVSRVILYVYTCWGGSSKSEEHDGALDYIWDVMQSKDILLEWMEEDPVDTWEMGRNDSVEAITGTRNVFVDYPELAFKLFNEDVPAGYDSPSGAGTTAGYTVTASTDNANYGTVSVSGNVITASPKTGYAATGYTILSGTATVTQKGNKFTVSPSSDVSVQINFSKREQVTVQFVEAGGQLSTQTVYAGDPITLPTCSGAVPDGQTFLGWASNEVNETTSAPTYYAAGDQLTITADVTLYALYSRFDEEDSGNSNTFELYSGAITEGDYIIVYNSGAMEAAKNGTASRLDVEAVSITDDKIQDPAAAIVWNIAKSGDYWTLYNASTNSYAIANGTKNQLVLGAAGTDAAKWTVTGDSTYEFVNVGNKAKNVNANLRRNTTFGFACYSTSTGGALTLYKRAFGTVYYFTAAKVVCDEHTYDNACDAYCNVCGASRTPADHAYTDKVTTAATCGKDGVRTYTCSVCGNSYTESIPATGAHTYDNACDADCNACGTTRTPAAHVYVSEVTVAATCGKDGVRTYTCSVCGNSYTESIPATGAHTYDNACDADCNACGTTRIPADHVYIANCDTICDVCGDERSASAGGETTVTFDADKTQREEFSTVKQVWQNGALTITNNKTSSSNNVADYTDPVRFYSGSEIIISYPGMTSLVIKASTASWEATLKAAKSEYDLEYEVLGDVYTITFADPIDSITLTASEQIRAYTITAIGAVAEHTYDDDYDADCNACGAIREVNYNLFDYSGGFSASEDVRGVAFKYTVTTKGMTLHNYVGDYTNATITLNERQQDIKLVAMGAVASNQEGTTLTRENALQERTVIDIPAKYFLTADADTATYAVRIINIPVEQENTTIYVRPYYVYEIDGVTFVCYGSVQSTSYAATIG